MPCNEYATEDDVKQINYSMQLLRNGVPPDQVRQKMLEKFYPESVKLQQELERSQLRSQEATGRRDQGKIGEAVAAQIAVNELGLYGVHFDTPERGLDGVFEDSKGNLVLMEAKLADAGLGALGSTSYGKQGSPEWVAECARQMQTPGSRMYSPTNAKLGERIEKVGSQNVRFIAISTDPQSKEATGYERQRDGSWKEIGKWDTREEGE